MSPIREFSSPHSSRTCTCVERRVDGYHGSNTVREKEMILDVTTTS